MKIEIDLCKQFICNRKATLRFGLDLLPQVINAVHIADTVEENAASSHSMNSNYLSHFGLVVALAVSSNCDIVLRMRICSNVLRNNRSNFNKSYFLTVWPRKSSPIWMFPPFFS